MKTQELKDLMTKEGFSPYTVAQVNNGKVSLDQNTDSVLEENQVSLHECFFEFSRNFNDEQLEITVNEINILIKHY